MTAARRMLILALLAIPPLLVLVGVVLTPDSELFSNQGDIGLYLRKASDFAAGGIPYRDFPFEYPPLAIVPMAVPYFLGFSGTVDLETYRWLFAGCEAALLVVLGAALMRIVRLGGDAAADGDADGGPAWAVTERQSAVALHLIVLSAGAVLAITFRFDLFPTVLMAIGVWAALGGRPRFVGVALGLGVLAKLFPVAVLPALAVPWLVKFDLRSLARLGASFVATVIVGLLPFVALAGSEQTFQFLRYNADRGLEVESIGGGIVMLAGLLRGQPVDTNSLFSSVNVAGPFADAWLALLPVLTIGGFALLARLGWRRIREETALAGAVAASTIVELATISLVMLLVTAKVYSIQYVVWLVPFFALLRGGRFWLASAIVALTIPIHPVLFGDLVQQEALPIFVLNTRNALLVALLVWMLRDLARPLPTSRGPGQPKASRSTPREVGVERKAEPRTVARALERAQAAARRRQPADGPSTSEGVARPAGLEPTTFRSAT